MYGQLNTEEKPTRLFKTKRVSKVKDNADLSETVSKKNVPVSEALEPEDVRRHESNSGERRASKNITPREEDEQSPPQKKLRISKPDSDAVPNLSWTGN